MCHRGTSILNTQGILVNFRALTEFNDDNRCIYIEVDSDAEMGTWSTC